MKTLADPAAQVASGAKIVLSRLPIGDLATQYFADRDIFCAGRVEQVPWLVWAVTNGSFADALCAKADLQRTCQATGAQIQTSLNDITREVSPSAPERL